MLRLENISFGASDENGEKQIIKNMSMTVKTGRFLAVTGPNGGGKSTLAKLIMGIEQPTSGRIFLDDTDITELTITERARLGIGFAFQQPIRFKGLDVLDLLRIASGKNLSISEACVYLSQVGLCAKDYINREINDSLSGGEIKRIEIAQILAKDPVLSIFDEPEAGIDLWSFQNLTRVFENMHKDSRRTIVVISHQERILNIADDIAVIAGGEIISMGSREEILPKITGTSSVEGYCRVMSGD